MSCGFGSNYPDLGPLSCSVPNAIQTGSGAGCWRVHSRHPASPASSGGRRCQPTDAARQEDAEEETAAEVSPQAPSRSGEREVGRFASPHSATPLSQHDDEDLVDFSPYVELVTKVMEGRRGYAFLMAKDLGLKELMDVGPPTGLELLAERIKEHVFPMRSYEARGLFRLGQQANGPLSRQSAETILSVIGKRKGWWMQLKELDPEMTISTQMRAELFLETSGLTPQEQLMVKTACPKPSFEGYSEILLEHHGRIHLRDSRNLAPPSGPFPVKGAGKNKGRGWYRSGYIAGEFDGHAGMKQQVMETTTTETRITVKEPMVGMVMSPVQRTQMIVTGY